MRSPYLIGSSSFLVSKRVKGPTWIHSCAVGSPHEVSLYLHCFLNVPASSCSHLFASECWTKKSDKMTIRILKFSYRHWDITQSTWNCLAESLRFGSPCHLRNLDQFQQSVESVDAGCIIIYCSTQRDIKQKSRNNQHNYSSSILYYEGFYQESIIVCFLLNLVMYDVNTPAHSACTVATNSIQIL